MNEDADTVATEIKRSLSRLTWAMVIVYIVLILFTSTLGACIVHSNNQLKAVASSTNSALCTFRADLISRVAESRRFLLNHPNGVDGISPADIQISISNQQQTIAALEGLKCPSP